MSEATVVREAFCNISVLELPRRAAANPSLKAAAKWLMTLMDSEAKFMFNDWRDSIVNICFGRLSTCSKSSSSMNSSVKQRADWLLYCL